MEEFFIFGIEHNHEKKQFEFFKRFLLSTIKTSTICNSCGDCTNNEKLRSFLRIEKLYHEVKNHTVKELLEEQLSEKNIKFDCQSCHSQSIGATKNELERMYI